ncbi:MAG: 6,7-dimethyl-8-ribityllumazine synthase [Betaproteobacteria bacterium]|nr:6,7-dimethyl-8-ribityllumazine synthase [Betaproteobacteria bacterium]MBI3935862.1 6,7-dimethyl-8-ribityllumazine synthase [Betaproteobacteria bacterium]
MARYDNIEELEPDLNGAGLRIGIVMSRFNVEVGEGLLSSCTAALLKRGVREADVRIVTVPGALEIPLALQRMAQSGRYDALIALGAVIRGETFHFEIVARESASGVTTVQLDTGVPVANGILTAEDDDQALARMGEKGADCATAAIEMANLLKKLD